MSFFQDKAARTVSAIFLFLCIATFAVWKAGSGKAWEELPLKTSLNCVIDLGSMARARSALIVGYNYHLLEQYARSNGQDIRIGIRLDRSQNFIDSLYAGSVDIVAMPLDSAAALAGHRHDSPDNSLIVSQPLDSINVFVMRGDAVADMASLNHFLYNWQFTQGYEQTRDTYLRRYNAFRSRYRHVASPYDDIIREHADSLGWDWRILVAVIYQESRFHIEARSGRGAAGLMQMMPRTASAFGVKDPLNPRESICGGARLLDTLLKKYSRIAANEDEALKFTLAAYNAGGGRIDDMIRLARLRGIDCSYWDNVVQVIPEMNSEEVLDTGAVRNGTFKGHETMAYVDRVLGIYERFKDIVPE